MPANYFNVESINPQPQQSAPPGLAGYAWAQDRGRYQNMAQVQDFLMKLQAEQEARKEQEARALAAERMASEKAKLLADTYLPGTKEADMLVKQQAAKKGAALLPSDIEAGISGNKASVAGNKSKELESIANWADMATQGLSSVKDPLQQQMMWNQIRGQLPSQIQTRFPAKFDPRVVQLITSLKQAAVNNIAQQRALDVQALKNKGSLDVANVGASATRYAADARATAASKDAKSVLLGKGSVATKWSTAAYVLRNETYFTPDVVQLAKDVADKVLAEDQARQARGEGPLIPGLRQPAKPNQDVLNRSGTATPKGPVIKWDDLKKGK